MIHTTGWESLLIHVSYHDGRFEVRIGFFCLLVIVLAVWKAIRSWPAQDQAQRVG